MENKRLYGIDFIKTISIFFVIAVHFFLNSGFYMLKMSGLPILVLTGLRWLFFTCVPLFLITTGFLRRKKEISAKYYISLIPIYLSYLIAATFAVLAKNKFGDYPSLGFFFNILSVLSFENGYSWYMDMFFGLALLIPFINITYGHLKAKSHKLALIAILLFMTGICSLDLDIRRKGITTYLLPDFWISLYPVTYYLIGAYISEYRPKINKLFGALSLIAVVAFEAVYTYIKSRGDTFDWGALGGYGGITVAISAVIIFLMFYDMEIKNEALQRLFTNISTKTLDIYMISYVVDMALYDKLLWAYPKFSQRILYMPFVIFVVFAIGYSYAKIKNYIFSFFTFVWKKIWAERNSEVCVNEIEANV